MIRFVRSHRNIMNKTITPKQLYRLILTDTEFALIDVREQGEFATSHILTACCVPLSAMEILMPEMVPRQDTMIVLVGDCFSSRHNLLHRAATCLYELGYRNISLLDGGIESWQNSGYLLFSGINTLSKAFGEFVEATYKTPRIDATSLKRKIDLDEKILIFDARPAEEFRRVSIPGALNVPGAELLYRFFELVRDPDVQVVINCAGRTRSIIGAQSLINAGVPNSVMALENGTMGWHLAGFELDSDRTDVLPGPSEASLLAAARCAQGVAKRYGVKVVERKKVLEWQKDTNSKNLYLLDVRSPEEFVGGHLIGSKNAPGGQLVQATDDYVAVRNARLVLVDDNEIRATMTASWLIQMGWRDIFVLSGGIGGMNLEKGSGVQRVADPEDLAVIRTEQLKSLIESRIPFLLIDVASSREYKAGHIPGAYWVIRSRLAVDIKNTGLTGTVVFTSPDGILACLAAQDLKKSSLSEEVMFLQGGTNAWSERGFHLEEGMTNSLSKRDDVWYRPYERENDSEKEMQAYLSWEVGLLDQIEKEGTVSFQKI